MADPKILKTVRLIGGKTFRPDSQEDAELLAQEASAEELKSAKDRGLISGKWKHKPQNNDLVTGELPNGFPGRMALVGAGFDALEKVRSATDEELLGVNGIGEGLLKQIREAL